MPKFIDLTGQKFGQLVVLKRVGNSKSGQIKWLCKCICENEVIVRGGNLKNGHTKSCGCFRIEEITKHGHAQNGKRTGFYTSWIGMIQRCINLNDKDYHNYGGRGIIVCDRWLSSFENFLEDMIKGWKPGLTLERINNELGYYKDNCEWITSGRQARNRRNNRCEEYNGENRLFVELCEEHNMPYGVVYQRYYNYSWTLKKSLTTPVGERR